MFTARRTSKLAICTPNKGRCGPENLLLDLSKGNIIVFPWEVRFEKYIPETTITLIRVLKLNVHNVNYMHHFHIRGGNTIVIPEEVGVNGKAHTCLEYEVRMMIVSEPPLGSYFMHFSAEYVVEEGLQKLDFVQKIQIVKR